MPKTGATGDLSPPKYKSVPSIAPLAPCNVSLSFVHDLLKCPLCHGLFKEPHSLQDCGDTFCKSCIIYHFQRFKHCPQCKTLHEVWPVMHLDKVMAALLDEFATAERVYKCTFAVKTPIEELETSLARLSPGDSRNKDISSSTIKTSAMVDSLLSCTCTPVKPIPTNKTTSKPLRIKKLKEYRNADPLARIAYSSGPNLLMMRPSQKRNFVL